MSYRRVVLRAFDWPEKIEFKDLAELPTLGAGEVQVHVVLLCAN